MVKFDFKTYIRVTRNFLSFYLKQKEQQQQSFFWTFEFGPLSIACDKKPVVSQVFH